MEKASVIFLEFLQRNGMVAVVILAVFAVRALLRKCPKKYSYALWAIVGIRMLFDLPIASGWSLFNLFRLVKSRSQMSEIAHYTGVSACANGSTECDADICRFTCDRGCSF